MFGGFEEAERQFTHLLEKYKAPSVFWFEAVESEIGPDGRELTRQILQGHIQSRGNGDIGSGLVTAQGAVLSHRRILNRTVNTMFGEVTFERVGYSMPGHPVVFPLDAVFNLPTSSFSAGLQRFIARRAPMMSFEEVLNLIQEITGTRVGKPQVLDIVKKCAIDFDAYYGAKKKMRGGEPILVLTTDGKGIVMRPEGLRESTRERAAKARPKLETRLAPGEKANRKRMAQVASTYFIDRFVRLPEEIIDELERKEAAIRRPRPSQKRVWASVEKEADDVIRAMFEEAHKRDVKHKKEWVILVDGHKHQLHMIKSLVKKEGVDAVIILDIIHVVEYLWSAARLFHEEKDHAGCEKWVKEQFIRVLKGYAGKVAGTIRLMAAKRTLTKAKQKTANICARYISRRKLYMRYGDYLKRGYPIANGVIEGACRHLIKDRMDLTGARWTLDGAEAMLKLRSLVSSGDFDDYWVFHQEQEYKRNHLSQIDDISQLKPILQG